MNSKNRDLVGESFGKWKVKSFSHKDDRGNRRWLCTCSCGRQGTIAEYALLSGHSKSCGKCRYEDYRDLTGEIFGEWKVIGLSHKDAKRSRCWLCLCSCGNRRVVTEYALLSGHSKSCRGCFTKHASYSQLSIASIDQSRMRKNNTSGIKGVSLDASRGKWVAHIRIAGKVKHLGYFTNKEDAEVAREKAVEQKRALLKKEGLL